MKRITYRSLLLLWVLWVGTGICEARNHQAAPHPDTTGQSQTSVAADTVTAASVSSAPAPTTLVAPAPTAEGRPPRQLAAWVVPGIACVLFLLLLLTIVSLAKIRTLKQRLRRLERSKDAPLRKWEESRQQIEGRLRQQDTQLQRMLLEQQTLSNKLEVLSTTASSRPEVQTPLPTTPPAYREAYFGRNVQQYFTSVSDKYESTSVFKVTFQSETEGTFVLVDLKQLAYVSEISEVIQYDGNCDIRQARRFDLIEPGHVVRSGECWKIDRPLRIHVFI